MVYTLLIQTSLIAEFGLVGSTAHQVDEHVAVKDIENLAKIYEEIIKKYF